MKIDLSQTQVINKGKGIPNKLWPFIAMFLLRHPISLFIFFLFVIFEAFLPAANSYILKMLIDGINATTNHPQQLIPVILLPVGLYIGVQILMNVIFTVHRIAQLQFYPKVKADIAGTIHHHLAQHSYRFFSEHFSGSLSKKIFDLCIGVESLIMMLTHRILPLTLAVMVSSTVLYIVQPRFGMILFFWGVIYIAVSFLLSRRSESLSYATSEAANVMSGKIVDSIINVMSTKLFANDKHAEGVVFDSINQMMIKDRALQWYLLKAYFVQGVFVTILIILMFVGLIDSRLNNAITVGDFALVLTLSAEISLRIFSIGEELLRFAKETGNCRQALNMIVEPHEIQDSVGAKQLQVTQGKIVFDKVQFQYEGAEPLFQNKTVTIEPGQKVGLVGHSGSGKSTFVNLVLRLFDVKQGSISIDGLDIKSVTQQSLRKNIGMIPQDPSLFHQTLFENIQYGRLDATYDEVLEAAKHAHAHEFIEALAKGYDSLVGERGVKLSGGQRQRVAIARAFLKNAPILILDEATSQLDSVTEQYIQESLWTLMQNKTTIVIAHRLSTLLHMDRILVFDQGRIVEDGTHEELLAKGGTYSKLWNAQVGGFLLDCDEGDNQNEQ